MTLVIGISGGTGSGKSTLALNLRAQLGFAAAILEQDWYYHDLRLAPPAERGQRNFDALEAIDWAALQKDLALLRAGHPVLAPRYDFKTHTRAPDYRTIEAAPVIIVEGLHVIGLSSLAPPNGLRVFVDAPEPLRYARRLARDVRERGRTPASVQQQWQRSVSPMHRLHVAPLRRMADLVVSGEGDTTCLSRLILKMTAGPTA